MEFPSSFSYSSLDTFKSDFRLISLQPSQATSSIECKLLPANLDKNPAYEALSYEWGQTDVSRHLIKVDGCDYEVRENLWLALRHLQLEAHPRVLWIDALCINQNDVVERSHQVAQMGRIYSQAERAVAWIGLEEEATNRVVEDESEGRLAIEILQELGHRNITTASTSLLPMETPPIFKLEALTSLCCRSYWERLWIIQELVLAKTVLVQCGPLSFNIDSFNFIDRPLLQAMDYGDRTKILFSLPVKIIKLRQERQEQKGQQKLGGQRESNEREVKWTWDNFHPWRSLQEHDVTPQPVTFDDGSLPLLSMMQETSIAKCADRRDKVFGLLNLSLQCCRDAIRPDYSRTLANICEDVLDHHISWHSSHGESSPIILTQMLLEGLGLKSSRIVGTPYAERSESFLSQNRATNSKLYDVNGTFQEVIWVHHPPDTWTNAKYARISPVPERLHSRLNIVLGAAMKGGLKPRFCPESLLEGEEAYFNAKSERKILTQQSGSHAILTNPLTKLRVSSYSGKPHIIAASSCSRNDENSSLINKGYLSHHWRQGQDHDGSTTRIAPRPTLNWDHQEWEMFVRSRADSQAAQGLSMFVTDEGQVGYASNRCNIGDLLCEIFDGSKKVAILERSLYVYKVVGKGILLHHNIELSGRAKKIELLKRGSVWKGVNSNETDKRTLYMRLDLAHLHYLSGYF